MYAERPAPNRLQRYRQALQTFQFPHDCMDPADCRSSAATKSGAARLRSLNPNSPPSFLRHMHT